MMTATASAKPTPAPSDKAMAKRQVVRRSPVSVTKLALGERSRESRELAAAILEVLAGARKPIDAAGALGVSLPRYYALEARALEGLLKACERRARGPRRSPEREATKLRLEAQRLEREVSRYQALLRAAQRAVGLRPAEPTTPKRESGGGRRRRRRPVARALRAVKVLRPSSEGLETPGAARDTDGDPKS